LRTELDGIIDRLERQQQTLEHSLSTETRGAKRRRLNIKLEVGRLQLKKALILRMNLTSTQGDL
jgi:exonuclease VII small subunit